MIFVIPSLLTLGFQVIAFCILMKTAFECIARKKTKQKVARIWKGNYICLSKADLTQMITPSQTTKTFFTYEREDQKIKIVEWLQNRVQCIVSKNPWLLSRIRNVDDKYLLWIPDAELADQSILNTCLDIKYVEQSECRVKKITSFEMVCGTGINCVDKDEPLWKITLMLPKDDVTKKSKPSHEFSIVVSMCHVLGDGATFYEIQNMLSELNEIESLRREPVSQEIYFNQDKDVVKKIPYSLMASLNRVLRILLASGNTVQTFKLDKEWIEREKNQNKNSIVPYVSTNDILMSVISNAFEYVSEVNMCVNMRGRVASLTRVHAGNFVSSKSMQPNTTASEVRQILVAPLTNVEITLDKSVYVTNWVGFFQEVKIPGAVFSWHKAFLFIFLEDVSSKIQFLQTYISLLFLMLLGHTDIPVASCVISSSSENDIELTILSLDKYDIPRFGKIIGSSNED